MEKCLETTDPKQFRKELAITFFSEILFHRGLIKPKNFVYYNYHGVTLHIINYGMVSTQIQALFHHIGEVVQFEETRICTLNLRHIVEDTNVEFEVYFIRVNQFDNITQDTSMTKEYKIRNMFTSLERLKKKFTRLPKQFSLSFEVYLNKDDSPTENRKTCLETFEKQNHQKMTFEFPNIIRGIRTENESQVNNTVNYRLKIPIGNIKN